MYSFDLKYVQAWSRPYIRSFDLIYVQVDLIYLTLDLIYQILTIYLKTDFCPIWRVINIFKDRLLSNMAGHTGATKIQHNNVALLHFLCQESRLVDGLGLTLGKCEGRNTHSTEHFHALSINVLLCLPIDGITS